MTPRCVCVASDEAFRRACEIRAIAAMTGPERTGFARGATVKRCRRALGCRYVDGVLLHCDRGPGCGRVAVGALMEEVMELLRSERMPQNSQEADGEGAGGAIG